MQRCPYLHEMKERLLSQPTPTDSLDMERLDGGTPVKEANLHNDYPAHANPGVIPDPPEMPPDSLIGTVVKVNEPQVSHQQPFYYSASQYRQKACVQLVQCRSFDPRNARNVCVWECFFFFLNTTLYGSFVIGYLHWFFS